jgi:thiopeptide-type bacteriocin biosynthesis protein
VLTIDDLLGALGLDAGARLQWYREVVTVRHESGDEYRVRSDELRRLLGDPDVAPLVLRQVLAMRRAAIVPLAAELDALAAGGRLTRPKAELCRSFVHLHCNRLLGSGPPFEPRLLGLLLRSREGLERAPVAAGGA